VVAVAGTAEGVMVMARRRVELAERGIRSAIQPYHAAASMELPEAEEFLSRSAASALADLKDYEVAGACVLMASGRPLGDLAKTLGSHALMHTAEGEFFRAAATLTLSAEEIEQRISGMGKVLGPPWTQDQKLCAAAGWLAVANQR
jgi:hypothetical protein